MREMDMKKTDEEIKKIKENNLKIVEMRKKQLAEESKDEREQREQKEAEDVVNAEKEFSDSADKPIDYISIKNIDNLNGSQFNNKYISITCSISALQLSEIETTIDGCCKNKKCKEYQEVKEEVPIHEIKCPECGNELKKICSYYNSYFEVWVTKSSGQIFTVRDLRCLIPLEALGIDKEGPENDKISSFFEKVNRNLKLNGKYIISKDTPVLWVDSIEIIDEYEDYSISKERFDILSKFFRRNWTGEEIDKYFSLGIKGLQLYKKACLLTGLSIKKVNFAGRKEYANIRIAVLGDGEVAKSTFPKRLESDLGLSNSLYITSEMASIVGLSGACEKTTAGRWIIKWGAMALCNNGFLILDGFHSLSREEMASLRESIEGNYITIMKAAKGRKEAAWRGVIIANCRKNICDFPNRYDATYEIGIGEEDIKNKFNDVDRRRVDCIITIAYDDVPNIEIMNEKISRHMVTQNSQEEIEAIGLLRELRVIAFTRKPEHVQCNEEGVLLNKIKEIINKWNKEYPGIRLAILGKKGIDIYYKFIIASAIFHFRIIRNDDGELIVQPKIDDVIFVKELFEENFTNLELDKKMALNS
jgi:hypothetical protein